MPLSLDAGTEEGETFYQILPDGPSPEDELIRKELIDRIMNILAAMPPSQRTVLTFRYLDGLSVEQTAARMGIPQGSVKSSAYYALKKVRGELGLSETADARPKFQHKKEKKGEIIMECTNICKYLFQYAKGELPEAVKTTVKTHLEHCPACRDIVTALKALIPYLPVGRPGETTHYSITIPSIKRTFSSTGCCMSNAEKLNAVLEKNNSCVPEGEQWIGGGTNNNFNLLAMFDNEGNEMEFEISAHGADDRYGINHYRYNVRKLRKIYFPLMWDNSVFEDGDDYYFPKQSYEAPNLYKGNVNNQFGADVNSGIYIAIPKNVSNVRVKRGNGVIDCGTYQFVYAQRYVNESETIWLEYSYNI